ncbi:MAG: SCO family protein [Anaerolineales bacterium]|nr:SCO family protein [Chloroflexota bacterium]MBL6982633.1 SCO family protein [Anaerolineales bacterium]
MEEKNRYPHLSPAWLAIIGIFLGILLAIAAYSVGRVLRPTPILRGAMLYPPVPAVDFRLQGVDDKNYSLYDFRDQPVLLTFSCIGCSQNNTLMSTLVEAKQLVDRDGHRLKVLIISVDPLKERFAAFVELIEDYDPEFLGLSGDQKEINDLARSYDVFFEIPIGENKNESSVALTSFIMLVDGSGNWRAVYPLRMAAIDIAADIKILLDEE